MRGINIAEPRIGRLVLRWSFVTLGAMLGLALILSQGSAQVQTSQAGQLRYVMQTKKTATFIVGKPGDINILLLNQYGENVPAGKVRRLVITATTLDSLESARKFVPKQPQRQTKLKDGYDDNTLVLGRGQKAAQISIKHEQNEKDKDVHVISHQPGRIHLFAEGENIATGDTVVIVRDNAPKKAIRPVVSESSTSEAILLPVVWQGANPARMRLEISPVEPQVQTGNGEQLAYFKVELHSATSGEYVGAPEEIKVVLKVKDGYARFDPEVLTIPKDDVITPDAAALKTRPGGHLTIRASARNADSLGIDSDERVFDKFPPGPHTTDLSVKLTRESAVANGLDELELTVKALQDETIVRPEDEGMEERIITLSLIGDARGVRFENGSSEVRIAKGSQKGIIKLFSSRPVNDLTVVAETYNGLNTLVTTKDHPTPIQFSFPWFQLLCACVGGVVFPLLWRQSKTMVATGFLLGAVFFGLALFGAIASDPQNLGTVSVILTKLPTEAFFASFILGLIGSMLIGVAFKAYFGTGGDGSPSEIRSMDTTPAQGQSKRVSDSSNREKSSPSPLKRQDDFVD